MPTSAGFCFFIILTYKNVKTRWVYWFLTIVHFASRRCLECITDHPECFGFWGPRRAPDPTPVGLASLALDSPSNFILGYTSFHGKIRPCFPTILSCIIQCKSRLCNKNTYCTEGFPYCTERFKKRQRRNFYDL